MMMAMGLAFAFMISFAAGAPGAGIGIGGAFALIGAAFFINAMLMNRSERFEPPIPGAYPPHRVNPKDPPPNLPS
jgi:hypothetical protein